MKICDDTVRHVQSLQCLQAYLSHIPKSTLASPDIPEHGFPGEGTSRNRCCTFGQ